MLARYAGGQRISTAPGRWFLAFVKELLPPLLEAQVQVISLIGHIKSISVNARIDYMSRSVKPHRIGTILQELISIRRSDSPYLRGSSGYIYAMSTPILYLEERLYLYANLRFTRPCHLLRYASIPLHHQGQKIGE